MHNKLENLMGKMGAFIYDNPFKVIVVVLALLAFPISHVPQIKMDTSTEGFMHPDDPVLLEYNAFRAQFGRDERVIVALKSDNIFTSSVQLHLCRNGDSSNLLSDRLCTKSSSRDHLLL